MPPARCERGDAAIKTKLVLLPQNFDGGESNLARKSVKHSLRRCLAASLPSSSGLSSPNADIITLPLTARIILLIIPTKYWFSVDRGRRVRFAHLAFSAVAIFFYQQHSSSVLNLGSWPLAIVSVAA